MTTCISCGKTRGPLGWFSWHKCASCQGSYCPTCFGELPESGEERSYKYLPARDCGNCGVPIVTPAFVPRMAGRF